MSVSNSQTDIIGCVGYLLGQGLGLTAGVLCALHFSHDASLVKTILIWCVCLFLSGLAGYLLMLLLVLPILKLMGK
jgi:hypothetical protein